MQRLFQIMQRLPHHVARWIVANLAGILAVGALAAIAVGFWMAWHPLGLIVPGAIVFAALVWTHVTGR